MPTVIERIAATRFFLGALSKAVRMTGLVKTAGEIDKTVSELADIEAELRAEKRDEELRSAVERRAATNTAW